MKLPPYMHVAEILYQNQLVTAYRAVDARTNTPVMVLVATPSVKICLVHAKDALDKLLNLRMLPELSICSLRELLETEVESILILGPLEGEPVRRRILSLEFLKEDALLNVALFHTRILAELHQAGYAGLRPTPNEIYWNAATQTYQIWGWEWLWPIDNDGEEDMRAALSLWCTLATGAPPPDGLSVDSDFHEWAKLSLALRTLIVQLWSERRGLAPTKIVAELEQIQTDWQRSPEDLVAESQKITTTDPARALFILDLAKRKAPRRKEIDERIKVVQAEFTHYLHDQIQQGRHAMELGQYDQQGRYTLELGQYRLPALEIFRRASEHKQAPPDLRLSAERWRIGAQCLSDAINLKISTPGFDVSVRSLERPLIEALELAAHGKIDAARAALDDVYALLPDKIALNALNSIHAELEVQHLVQNGRAREQSGKLLQAAQMYEEALAKKKLIPYWDELKAIIGDLSVNAKKVTFHAETRERAIKLLRTAKQKLAAGDFNAAREDAQAASILFDNRHESRVECLRLARQAELCQETVDAGANEDLTSLSAVQQQCVLAALARLELEFPGDAWYQQQRARWEKWWQNLVFQAMLALANGHQMEARQYVEAILGNKYVTNNIRLAAQQVINQISATNENRQKPLTIGSPILPLDAELEIHAKLMEVKTNCLFLDRTDGLLEQIQGVINLLHKNHFMRARSLWKQIDTPSGSYAKAAYNDCKSYLEAYIQFSEKKILAELVRLTEVATTPVDKDVTKGIISLLNQHYEIVINKGENDVLKQSVRQALPDLVI